MAYKIYWKYIQNFSKTSYKVYYDLIYMKFQTHSIGVYMYGEMTTTTSS